MAGSELRGVVNDPKLLSGSGLWVTFHAREPCCGARLLLNVRSREQLDDETLEEVFRAAGRSRDLRHPSVLSSRRFGSTDDVVWVTTRAYRGRLLRIIPGTEPGTGRSRALDFIRRVAGPLEAVHRDGLVHGALGETSFHCDTEGRIRIRNLELDVPLVRRLGPMGLESRTVACAAPEVLDGATPVVESDQYALAALLVRLLTGQAPEANGSVEWHAVPGPMRRPLRRALRLDPEERFATVLDLWDALDPEQSGRRSAPRRGGFEPRPDAEMPGSPKPPDHRGAGDTDDGSGAWSGRRGPDRPPPKPDGASTPPVPRAGRRDTGSDRRDGSGPRRRSKPYPRSAAGAGTGPDASRSTMGSWGRRRRKGRGGRAEDGGSGPWSRTFAAAAALVLLFGTVEVVGEWDRISPFSDTPPDTLPPTALSGASSDARTELGRQADAGDRDGRREQEPIGGEEISIPRSAERDGSEPEALGPESGDREGENEAGSGSTTRPPEERESASVAATEEVPDREPARPPRTTPMSRSSADADGIAQPREAGVLSLHSYPWGEVYLDGDYVGNSPIVDLRVSAGSHEIRIERDGYEPYVEMITVDEGQAVRRTGIVLRSGGR